MDDMQYSISFLLLKVENRLIHYSYEKVEPFIISIPGSYGSHFPIMLMMMMVTLLVMWQWIGLL